MAQALAIKYRPKVFDDVVEQNATKIILEQQLANGEVKHSYLFVGSAGTGKTTCARIFANEINKGKGNPIEIDAASHGNVSDIRDLVIQAKSKPLDADYKIFIIDECHCLSAAGWSAMLKLIEEPPVTAIFIFCTTDVQKVPKTIMSRCQRFDFQRISLSGIINRLQYICKEESLNNVDIDALDYIAKLADGGMRDSITYLDKALSFNQILTVENVVKALGTVDYEVMINLTNAVIREDKKSIIQLVEDIHNAGKDLKLFIKNYIHFLLDVLKLRKARCGWEYVQFPKIEKYEKWVNLISSNGIEIVSDLLTSLVRLQSDIKYSSSPKYDIEVTLLLI